MLHHAYTISCSLSLYSNRSGVTLATAAVATGKGAPKEQFKHSRIPGSRFFDMDNIADKSSSLPHMLPSEQAFAAAADCLGIANDTQVVVYDRSGLFSAARVWWTFKIFGHEK